MLENLVKFEEATFCKYQHPVFSNSCWEMHQGENWAITGVNGSGKTTFLEALEGRLMKIKGQTNYSLTDGDGILVQKPDSLIAAVYFNDHSVNYDDFYYQQRYHATETEGIITVRSFLGLDKNSSLPELEALDIQRLLDMEIIKLSNGQFKKMLIVKALLRKPRLLLLDNLYTGLDTRARTYISDTLSQITKIGTQIVMVVDDDEIPDMITHVMEIDKFAICRLSTRDNYLIRHVGNEPSSSFPVIPVLPEAPAKTFEIAVNLDKITITYDGNKVLDCVEWTIRQGEKWALTGPNGAGKSMLLSLIFADNPQAYANKIILFDRQRGTGESIWDIKDNIGFISPEMHVYFRHGKTCREVALSGLQENPYKRAAIIPEITGIMEELFEYFSMTQFVDSLFQRVSTGQQNIVLLIRAMLKNPPMLVLDEPFQGLDKQSVERARRLLDTFCSKRTLIFVSHRPTEIPSCVTRHLSLERGCVIGVGN